MISRIIAGHLQSERWKLVVRALCLLQANDLRLCRLEPCKETVLAFAQRVNIPRDNAHRRRMRRGPVKAVIAGALDHRSRCTGYNSNSMPGIGTNTSVFGSSFESVTRIHSTAGGSPCTRTILLGESLLA